MLPLTSLTIPQGLAAYSTARDEVDMSEIDVALAAEEQRRKAQLRALGGEINSFYTWLTGAEAGRRVRSVPRGVLTS